MSGYYDQSGGMGGLRSAGGRSGGALAQAIQFEQAHREQNIEMDEFRQSLAAQQAHDAAIHQEEAAAGTFTGGISNGDNSISASPGANTPWVRGADGKMYHANTPMLVDQNGVALQTPAALNNIAAQSRAVQGYDVGQQSKAQVQADTMRGLSQAIMNMPPEDRQIAYERAVGVMAGRGTLQIHDMPEWTKGGQEFVSQMSDQKAQQDQALQVLKNMGTSNQAMINRGFNPDGTPLAQPAAPGASAGAGAPGALGAPQQAAGPRQQLLDIINNPTSAPLQKSQAADAFNKIDENGQPVGAPISARAAKMYTTSALVAQHAADLSDLMRNNPQLNITESKLAGSLGGLGNYALSPAQQKFNTLTGYLDGAIKNLGDSGADKGQIDRMSKLNVNMGDSPQTAAVKLQMLQQEANVAKTAVDPSGHIASLLAQQQQQQQPGQAATGMVAPSGPMQQMPPQQMMGPQQQMPQQQMPQQRMAPPQMPQQQQQMAPPQQQAPAPNPQILNTPLPGPQAALQPGDRLDYNQGAPVLQPGDRMDYNT